MKFKKEYVYLSLIILLLAIVIYQTFFIEEVVTTGKEEQEFTNDFFREENQKENQDDSSVRIRSYAYVQAQEGLIELPLENASSKPAEMAVSIEGEEIFRSERALNPGETVIARLTEEEVRELGGDKETVPFTARVIPAEKEEEGTTGMGFGYRGTFLLN